MTTLEEKLRSEERICPECRCSIGSPLAERCPRCLAALAAMDPVCGKCIYTCSCPAASAPKAK
jgi:hypothetical protein